MLCCWAGRVAAADACPFDIPSGVDIGGVCSAAGNGVVRVLVAGFFFVSFSVWGGMIPMLPRLRGGTPGWLV